MNPWQVLEVAKSADVRTIKRAYAKKLKMTRPEEKPNEFQTLHQAYKLALGFAESKVSGTVDVSVEIAGGHYAGLENSLVFDNALLENSSNFSVEGQGLADLHDRVSDDVLEQAKFNEMCDLLASQVERNLEDELVSGDRKDWVFLTQSPHLLNDEFNWKLGLLVFKQFSGFQGKKIRRARGRYYHRDIPENIIIFCDHIFSWSNKKDDLVDNLGYEMCQKLFEQLDNVHFSDPEINVRGGEIIRSPSQGRASARLDAARRKNDDGPSFWFLFFIFFGVAKLIYFLYFN